MEPRDRESEHKMRRGFHDHVMWSGACNCSVHLAIGLSPDVKGAKSLGIK